MKFDTTITFSIILSFCALLSPSITAFFNNRHQYRMRKLELEYEEQRQQRELLYLRKFDIYQKFVTQVFSYDWMEQNEDTLQLSTLIQQVMLMCDPQSLVLLKQLQNYVNGHHYSFDKFNNLISAITESLNRELNDLSSRAT